MGTTRTAAKLKYNKETYRYYELRLIYDTHLYMLVEMHKEKYPNISTNELIKRALCGYFGLSRALADDPSPEYRIGPDLIKQRNTDLNPYMQHVEEQMQK